MVSTIETEKVAPSPNIRLAPIWEEKAMEIMGETMTYWDEGKGKVLVLLHGFLGSKAIWSDMITVLKKSFRVIAIDLPGHGGSTCYGYVHQMEIQAKMIKALCTKLRIKRYVMIGHSMGGYVALAFAELFTDNLKGLGLFHSTAWADAESKKKDRERAIQIVKRSTELYTAEMIKNLFPDGYTAIFPEVYQYAHDMALMVPKRAVAACLEGMKVRPNRDIVLRFAPYPVFYFIGKKDAVLAWDQLEEQSTIAERQYVVLAENIGHMGMLEDTNSSVKHIRRFTNRCYLSAKQYEKYKKHRFAL